MDFAFFNPLIFNSDKFNFERLLSPPLFSKSLAASDRTFSPWYPVSIMIANNSISDRVFTP